LPEEEFRIDFLQAVSTRVWVTMDVNTERVEQNGLKERNGRMGERLANLQHWIAIDRMQEVQAQSFHGLLQQAPRGRQSLRLGTYAPGSVG
jgi:hypothetical protein